MGVTSDRVIRNLALIGFMGTGKSSVGRALADQLHYQYLDSDETIESWTGKSVSRIFAEDGEPAFRSLERKWVQQLSDRDKTVISTGGGLVVDPENLASLKHH